MEDRKPGLPHSLEAAWGLRTRPGYGPKPGLSLEKVVDAAVALAGADGLVAVSMVKVAKALGVSTMALYRYVAAKDELLELMIDRAIGEAPPVEEGIDWREGMSRWARAYLVVLRRHRWIIEVPIAGPPIAPNQLGWLELGLRYLAQTGLSGRAKLSAVMMIAAFVRTVVIYEVQARAPRYDYAAELSRVVDREKYREIVSLMIEGAIDDEVDNYADEFSFELGIILDGVAALMAR
ncbi:TetR family transcriptional regulator [Actinorhabdospora filicis]|uniref:TetR family transcriptional regulator n=1 Tax=Actinorhabdospora filicis TaxID=1785913 RepID=A0A9W6W570_9ACTN|nr:TetR/AcrR family transcriptional regulator [Actinorhabdospora filicis]GLZ80062.1 TetR family transcriptional regulator [Actinorhabdospora filicis]